MSEQLTESEILQLLNDPSILRFHLIKNYLSIAACNGYVIALKCIFDVYPRSLEILKNSQYRILQYAAVNGHTETLKLLLTYPEAIHSLKKGKAVLFAAANGQIESLKVLITYTTALRSLNDGEALRVAAIRGYVEIVDLILRNTKLLDRFFPKIREITDAIYRMRDDITRQFLCLHRLLADIRIRNFIILKRSPLPLKQLLRY